MSTAWTRSELTYCTNVHPGESLAQVSAMLGGPLAGVRNKRHLSTMSGGLWLSNPTAQVLSSANNLQLFADQLQDHAITLFTLNGFPAQGFHGQRIKEAVYHPDWSEPERLDYSLRLAHILAALLAEEIAEGTISTVPLGFTPHWSPEKHKLALDAICQCLLELEQIQVQSKRSIRLCLEMEPGCVLEDTNTLIRLFTEELPQHAASRDIDPELIKNHLGICFDVCHQAVMFEDVYQVLQQIHQASIAIGKIQISSALELTSPEDSEARNCLAGFIEDTYLHQSCCVDEHGQLLKVMDLDEAFSVFPHTQSWRVHFHVPIQAETLLDQGLHTTQQEIGKTLDFLQDHPEIHPHLEVETYTWSALPETIRPKNEQMMIDGITRELHWLETQMQSRGLLQDHRL